MSTANTAIDVARVLIEVGRLPSRDREVLVARFGLADGRIKSLAKVGEMFGLDRGEVRQIEAGAMRVVVEGIEARE